ncbi:glycoside hydrolase family 73 protein [Paludibacterium yongneupense]|uniref:glycoside hydrolase family 73 protein n=1 Tax=Paludibacterium yongneupense TaxID=400061 RepID=UPI000419024E|nr:glucosaminidase domain-containing protein [Paludibacterium yongneupense]
MTPHAFIALIGPAAQASSRASDIPASFTVAQAALESGWGESRLAREAKNLFGIKAGPAWPGEILTLETREFIAGEWVMQTSHWRKYPSWRSGMDDHAAFLCDNPRYARCFDHRSGEDFAAAVARAGYATDPDYAAKLQAIIVRYRLGELDSVA